jgi:phage gpG-like protein
MSATIEFQISGSAQAAIQRLTDSRLVLPVIARELDQQLNLTVGHIVAKRLTGTGPFPVSEHRLGVRTGHLRRSLRTTKATVTGNTVTGAIGTNVKYAGIHEFGGTIKRLLLAGSVRLATDRKGNLLRQGKNGKLAVFARASRKTATTVAYAGGKRFDVVIPERAPIRTGIADRQQAMGEAVTAAILKFAGGDK